MIYGGILKDVDVGVGSHEWELLDLGFKSDW